MNTSGLIAYELRVRRLELIAMILSAGLSALLWRQEIPTRFFRPDLNPEQMLHLFAVLQATCFLLAVRRVSDDRHLRLASINIPAFSLGLIAAYLAVYSLAGWAAATAMPAESAATYLRNLVAYAGVGLLLGRRSVTLSMSAVWIWLAVSMGAGRSLDQGQVAFQWWAYPLQDPAWHPEVAAALLAAGVVSRVLR